MIDLPDRPAPNGVNIIPIDFGFLQRPASGAASLRIDRPGNRYRAEFAFPPMTPETAAKFTGRLERARRQGLRMEIPLLEWKQGSPGTPVVDGADPTGTTLPLRGLTPGYAAKEGFWLNVIDADGNRYLHRILTAARADAAGEVTLDIEPAIRTPLADGSAVVLAKPTIEGVVIDEMAFSISVDRLVRIGGSVVVEEAA